MIRLPPSLDEDELDDLPPLDGETVDAPEAEPSDGDDELPETDGDDGALSTVPLDDPLRDGAGISFGEGDASWLNEAPDSPDLDLGGPALVQWEEEDSPADESEPSRESDEDLEAVQTDSGELDSGDEGPRDPDEELRDQDLPALDADAEGEAGDAGFVDARFAADEPLGLPWAVSPWSRVGAPLSLPAATAITHFGRGALVTLQDAANEGTRLIHVDLEGSLRALPAKGWGMADPSALSLAAQDDGSRVALVLRGGSLLVSNDGGQHFEFVAKHLVAAECLFVSGCLWIRTQNGELWVSGDGPPERCALPGLVAAIAMDGTGGVVGLVMANGGGVGTVRGDSMRSMVVEAVDGGPPCRLPAFLAAVGGHVAYAGSKGGVVRREPRGVGTQAADSSGPWRSRVWDGIVTALSFADEAGTLLAATYSDADDTTALVCLDASDLATVVARVGAVRDQPDSDGRALGMARDDARGVVWVAGGFGATAFAQESR